MEQKVAPEVALWKFHDWSSWDKSILITGPDEMVLNVDYDDVDHDAVRAYLPLIVEALNGIVPPVIERTEEDEDEA